MSNILTCVYCGHESPEGTPPHGSSVLTDHIKVCEKHPMSKLKKENDVFRKAFLLMSGCSSFAELEGLFPVMKAMESKTDGGISADTNAAIKMVLAAVAMAGVEEKK